MAAAVTVVPANEAAWADLEAVLGAVKCHGGKCYCQRFKLPGGTWSTVTDAGRADLLHEQAGCGTPGPTSGLVAYLDGEPVGWCAVEPRTAYAGLRTSRVPWTGRAEDKDDPGVWAVTCLITRPGFRRRGVTGVLATAAIDFARERGAKALEVYAMFVPPGQDVAWGELHVGSHGTFADAGFTEVSRPSKRRVVMRVDF